MERVPPIRRRRLGCVVLLAMLSAALAARATSAQTPNGSRFYFSGDGTLDLRNAHFDEHLTVQYRGADGRYDPGGLARIERFFRSRTDGKSGPISLRLIELLDFVEDRYRPARLTLVSGYRSPEFNQALRSGGRRVALASLHTEGLAADVQPEGLDLHRLWLQLRTLQTGGVGLYQADGFLHLDVGRARFWEPSTAKVEQNLSADNARLFARTDFDRYDDLDGALIRLHAITALPIRIQRTARLGRDALPIAPRNDGVTADGDCWVIVEPTAPYEFTVTGAHAAPAKRQPIRLQTCAPRVGATAKEILTNPVEGMVAGR